MCIDSSTLLSFFLPVSGIRLPMSPKQANTPTKGTPASLPVSSPSKGALPVSGTRGEDMSKVFEMHGNKYVARVAEARTAMLASTEFGDLATEKPSRASEKQVLEYLKKENKANATDNQPDVVGLVWKPIATL